MSAGTPDRRGKIRSALLRGVPAVLIVALSFASLRVRDFVKRDPEFCGMCHQQRVDPLLWSEGAHASIVCQQCHHQDEADALRTLIHVVDGTAVDRLHSPEVPVDSCGDCHMRHDRHWPEISASLGHTLHARKNVPCQACHATAIHEYGIALDTCKDCHEKQVVKATGMERLHCDSCHNFLTPDRSLKPDRATCLRCHSSKVKLNTNFPQNAAMATFPCFACHKPHVDSKATYVACVSCHKTENKHGLHRIPEHQECSDCHKPHTWLSERAMCTKCHKQAVSHYAHKECRECHEFTAARARMHPLPDLGAPSETRPK